MIIVSICFFVPGTFFFFFVQGCTLVYVIIASFSLCTRHVLLFHGRLCAGPAVHCALRAGDKEQEPGGGGGALHDASGPQAASAGTYGRQERRSRRPKGQRHPLLSRADCRQGQRQQLLTVAIEATERGSRVAVRTISLASLVAFFSSSLFYFI